MDRRVRRRVRRDPSHRDRRYPSRRGRWTGAVTAVPPDPSRTSSDRRYPESLVVLVGSALTAASAAITVTAAAAGPAPGRRPQ